MRQRVSAEYPNYGAFPLVLLASALTAACPQLLDDDFTKATGVRPPLAGAAGTGTGPGGEDGTGGLRLSLGGGNDHGGAPTAGSPGGSDSWGGTNPGGGQPLGGAPANIAGAGQGGAGGAEVVAAGGASLAGTAGFIEGGRSSAGAAQGGSLMSAGTAGLLTAGTSSAGVSGTPSGGTDNPGAAGSAGQGGGCGNQLVLSSAVSVDFDAWDGAQEPLSWQFHLEGAGEERPLGNLYALSDGTGEYSLDVIAESGSDGYLVYAAHTDASAWGGGIGMRLQCLDARELTGLRFSARGTAPNTSKEAIVGLELQDGTTVESEVELLRMRVAYEIPFIDFEGTGAFAGATTDGSGIVGVFVALYLDTMTGPFNPGTPQPVPGDYEIRIDDVGFY